MKVRVVVVPGAYLCSSCGYVLSSAYLEKGATSIIVECQAYRCERRQVRLIVPLETIECAVDQDGD